jgi:hypothetical protein
MQPLDAPIALAPIRAVTLRVALVKAFARHEGDADIAAALDAVDFLARATEIVEGLDDAA